MLKHRSLALCAGMAMMAVLSPHAADAASPHLDRHADNPTQPLGAPEDLGSNVMTIGHGFDSGGGSSPTDLATTAAAEGHVTGDAKLDHSKMTSIAGASADNPTAFGDGHIGHR